MKTLKIFSIVLFCCTLATASFAQKVKTETFKVSGNCGMCEAKIEKAAAVSAELIWNMPLTDAHVKDMKGTFADLSNVSSATGAGSATAAGFLEQFVDSEIPWAHFDIAGTAWACGNRLNYCSAKGATGVMVRTFVELAKQFAK